MFLLQHLASGSEEINQTQNASSVGSVSPNHLIENDGKEKL